MLILQKRDQVVDISFVLKTFSIVI